MSRTRILALAWLCLLVLASAARADETPIRIGGNHEVRVERDVAYGPEKDPEPRRTLDLYLPRGVKDFPVLFFVHGGTWSRGDKRMFARQGETFARNGVGVVAINYRLSPKAKHPDHIEDVARAFAWTHKNIARHGGDPGQVFVSGHSAGGHLVALLATDERYLQAEGLTLKTIRGVLALSGVYIVVPLGRLADIFGGPESALKASPMAHVEGKKPPFLALYAERDFPQFDQLAKGLCKALVKGKNEARSVEIADRTHRTILTRLDDEADPATQLMLAFVAKHSGLKLRDRR